jgi:hypothetical protein
MSLRCRSIYLRRGSRRGATRRQIGRRAIFYYDECTLLFYLHHKEIQENFDTSHLFLSLKLFSFSLSRHQVVMWSGITTSFIYKSMQIPSPLFPRAVAVADRAEPKRSTTYAQTGAGDADIVSSHYQFFFPFRALLFRFLAKEGGRPQLGEPMPLSDEVDLFQGGLGGGSCRVPLPD